MKLVYKLLSRRISAWQWAGFFLANLLGTCIVLGSVQFYHDVAPLFRSGDSFMKPGYMVVAKHVSALRTLGGADTGFSPDEVDELRRQPFARSVGEFTPAGFEVYASVAAGPGGPAFGTEMFFEALPDAYVDVDLSHWRYEPGSGEVPVVVPRNYLNLYNFGFARSRGLRYRVYLGVRAAADLVALPGRDAHLFAQAARLQTMAHAGGRTVVTGGQDVPVLDGDGAHLAAQAGGALAHQIGDAHEIIGPGHSLHDSTRNKKLDYLTRSRGKCQARRWQGPRTEKAAGGGLANRGAFRKAPSAAATGRSGPPAGAAEKKREGPPSRTGRGLLPPVVHGYQVNRG